MKKTLNALLSSHGSKKYFILLAIIAAYASFVSIKFGIQDGLSVTLLTWAFFVGCTPIADAGFLIDFPVRILLGVKMIFSEMIVWASALLIITYNLILNPDIFSQTTPLRLLLSIINHPWPLWNIVLVSAIGTFLSVYIGDQVYSMIDARHKHEHIKRLRIKRLILELSAFAFVLALFVRLLSVTGVQINI